MTKTVHKLSLSGNKNIYLKNASPDATAISTGLGLQISTINYAAVISRELAEKIMPRGHANTKAPGIALLCSI